MLSRTEPVGSGPSCIRNVVCLGLWMAACAVASAQQVPAEKAPASKGTGIAGPHYDCGYISPEQALKDLRDAVRRGEIADPLKKKLPAVAPRVPQLFPGGCVPTPTPADLFPFEDTAGLLVTNFSNGALFGLMTDAANALIAAEGDNFDYIAFWVNFTPNHTIGTAFYLGLENDVSGIGQGIFNSRPSFGLAGVNTEGYVMMWNINSGFWQPGTDPNAAFTRLVLGQEFEHRFGMFLPNLLDGRRLQGDDAGCGRSAHWNFKVDGQGSGMEIAEWVGASPATRIGGSLNFNTDIGGVWSYTDLYLMGYVSPAEMDAGNSELRYMNNSCNSPYNGTISAFSSADIVASAGARVPDSTSAQQNFRTGWIMIHLPGSPPTTAELTKAAGIMDQWSNDWNFGTLGRGLMNNTFRPDCSAKVEWRPVSANVPHTITGNQITVPTGGGRVTLDAFVSAWDPSLLSSYQLQLDSTGYTSGTAGNLSPLTVPDASAGAFIDTARGDFVFSGKPSVVSSVDTTTLDYVWSGNVSAADAVSDPGVPRYAGTLIVNVSPDAEGNFRVGFLDEPATQLADDASVPITPLTLTPAIIRVPPGNTACVSATDLPCDSTAVFDNSTISNPPNPLYSCGSGSNHDGTLWFKFTATSADARLSTCTSVAQDSTFALYGGTCGALNEIACSEDECGPSTFLGDTAVTGLVVGQTYYIQISAWQPSDRGSYALRLECGIVRPSPPLPDPVVPDAGNGTRNRYLSFSAGEPGKSQAVRVTFTGMPSAFQSLVGTSMWAGLPEAISENSGVRDPASAPGFASFQASQLQCTPFATDFGSLGVIHVFGNAVIPGASYDVQVVDAGFTGIEQAFSNPLAINTSIWGDSVTDCTVTPCGPPDGSVDVVTDVVAAVEKFKNSFGAPSKTRVDLSPAVPDQIIDTFEFSFIIAAFKGNGYPFPPPAPCP